MKKFIQSIAAFAVLVFAAVACQSEALAPAEPSTTPGATPIVKVEVLSTTDTGFTFQVTPSGNVSFYTCLVSTEEIATPNPEAVYALSYDNILAKRLVYEKDKSYTGEVSGVDFNSNYYIYAVAANAECNVSSVASASVRTTDTVAPGFVVDEDGYIDYEFEENQVLLTFSEDITYDESKKITANVYAKLYLLGAPVIQGTVAEVQTQDNQALLTFPEIKTPGSYYVVNIPAGAFVDAMKQATPAVVSGFSQGEKGVKVEGIYGYLENGELEVELPEATTIENLEDWIKVGVPAMVSSIDSKAKFTTDIKHVESGEGVSSVTVTTYDMAPMTHFGGDLTNIMVRPAGTPAPKDEITITIPAKACQDIYGNTNSEPIVLGPYTYAYTAVYPKTGKYIVNNGKYPFEINLVAVVENEAYALQADWFAGFNGEYANPVLYFTVDEPSRTLTCDGKFIYNGQLITSASAFGSSFYYYDEAGTQVLAFFGGGESGKEPIVITYDDEGNLTTISYCEYSIFDATTNEFLGVFDSCEDGTTISPKVETESKPVNFVKRFNTPRIQVPSPVKLSK